MTDEKIQKELNTPLIDSTGVSSEDSAFLDLILGLVNDGKIDLYRPETLLNHAVYDELREDKQGKVDLEALNMLSAIREIKDLNDNGYKETFQMNNLVSRLRLIKERLEEEGGDLFII